MGEKLTYLLWDKCVERAILASENNIVPIYKKKEGEHISISALNRSR